MYNEIETEFAPKFKDTDLDFKTEFNKAYAKVEHYDPDTAKNAIKGLLSDVLMEYARLHPNKWYTPILIVVSKVVKWIKIK